MIVEPGLLDHPKFLRLQRRIGDRALHVLFRLWAHCQSEQRGERWRATDAEYLAAVARWEGESGKLLEDLCACGFVEEREGALVIHDWNDHNANLRKSWVNGRYGGRPKKPKSSKEANPLETHGFPESASNQTYGQAMGPQRREEKRREEKTSSSLPPSQSTSARDVEVESSVPKAFSRDEIQEINQVWAVWPKRIETIPAQISIGRAIQRHGLDVVLAGTRRIVEAEAKSGSKPPGRYLPRPTDFFDSSRYLDDAEQYAPRNGAVTSDPSEIRRRIADLQKQVEEHPGNPANTAGSLERKKEAREEFEQLRDQLLAAKAKLSEAITAPA